MRLRTRYTQRLPVAPGLRLDIPFFEGSGTKVLDVSGKGNHGTITDAVWTRDENGVAMTFNGTSAYIDCGNDASLNITDAITIEAWVKGDMHEAALAMAKDGGSTRAWQFWVNTNGYFDWIIWNSGGTLKRCKTNAELSDDIWYHLVGTYNGSQQKLFVDGVEQTDVETWSDTIKSSPNVILAIGAKSNGTVNFNGTIKGVRIYAVALTAEQIKRRYEQTKRDYVRAS